MANKQKQTWEQKAQAEMESKTKSRSVDTLVKLNKGTTPQTYIVE